MRVKVRVRVRVRARVRDRVRARVRDPPILRAANALFASAPSVDLVLRQVPGQGQLPRP